MKRPNGFQWSWTLTQTVPERSRSKTGPRRLSATLTLRVTSTASPSEEFITTWKRLPRNLVHRALATLASWFTSVTFWLSLPFLFKPSETNKRKTPMQVSNGFSYEDYAAWCKSRVPAVDPGRGPISSHDTVLAGCDDESCPVTVRSTRDCVVVTPRPRGSF